MIEMLTCLDLCRVGRVRVWEGREGGEGEGEEGGIGKRAGLGM